MRRKLLALLLTLATCLSLVPAFSVYAAEEAETMDAETVEAEAPAPEPDPEGTVSFENLQNRMKSDGLTTLVLEETIAAAESVDFDNLQEYLRKQLNQTASFQWMLVSAGQGDSYAAAAMQQGYRAMREQFDDLKDGEIQKDAADALWQLRNLRDSVLMGGESLYLGIAEMEARKTALQRKLEALDRTVQEMELRYALGQISTLNLEQVKAGRTSLVSGQQTLDMTISSYKLQLEQMIGAPLTGEIALAALPSVTGEELDAMDLEADLAAAKEASYELRAAQVTLDDAKDDRKDANKYSYERHTLHYMYVQAEHTWQAAQYTYQNTIQDYERRFRVLYMQVKDYAQILAASEAALAVAKDEYAAEKAKFDLGNLSSNALADAKDSVSSAEDDVAAARRNLFTAYNNYRWAVDYGILN